MTTGPVGGSGTGPVGGGGTGSGREGDKQLLRMFAALPIALAAVLAVVAAIST